MLDRQPKNSNGQVAVRASAEFTTDQKKVLPNVQVGQRFVVDGLDRLPPVELVRKFPTTWLVAEINPDGTLDRAMFRLAKTGLIGRTVRILPGDFKPNASHTSTDEAVPRKPED